MSNHPTQRAKRATSQFSIRVVVVFLVLSRSGRMGTNSPTSDNNSYWADVNLWGSVTDQYSSIASFITTPNDDLHVYYQASDDHVHQLYNWGGGWTDEDLTAETGAVPSESNSSISGFSAKNWQYVFYVGTDHHVHMLLFTDHWFDTDLTRTGNGGACRATLVAFVTSPNNDLHVYYTEIEGDVEQLYNGGSGWKIEDLTEEVGGNRNGGGEITGFSLGNSQYGAPHRPQQ